MKNLRSASTQGQKRSSSIISRIRAHQRGDVVAPDSSGSFSFEGGVDVAAEHNMLSTPYILTRPAVLT